MGDLIDIEVIRTLLKSRDAWVDLDALFDIERETSASQDIDDYNAWVDKFLVVAQRMAASR